MSSRLKYLLLSIFLLGTFCGNIYAQQMSVKTNALFLAAGVPNFGFEVVTTDHTSLEVMGVGAYKPYGLDLTLGGASAEFRYWFSGRPLVREFIGVSLLASTYDINLFGNVYKGDAAGAALSFGYVIPLSTRFNLEFRAGLGALYFRQIHHNSDDNLNDYVQGTSDIVNERGIKFLPTQLGISFSYLF